MLGGIDDAADLFRAQIFDAVIISIGTSTELRARIYAQLVSEGIPFTNVIDPRAAVLSGVTLGAGNAIMPLSQVAAGARVGNNNFISALVDIEHHNTVGDHCTFGPGVMTSGGVQIGSRVKFGAGVMVEPQLSIGDECVIASGSVITRSIPARSIVKSRENYKIRPVDR